MIKFNSSEFIITIIAGSWWVLILPDIVNYINDIQPRNLISSLPVTIKPWCARWLYCYQCFRPFHITNSVRVEDHLVYVLPFRIVLLSRPKVAIHNAMHTTGFPTFIRQVSLNVANNNNPKKLMNFVSARSLFIQTTARKMSS